jgi:hypothetical protein
MVSRNNKPCTESATTTPHSVERRTGLRGLLIGAGKPSFGKGRNNTESELRERDTEIPYWKLEAAHRDLVCSIMERQDRMNEELLQRIVDLQYRMDDLEAEHASRGRKTPALPGAP